MTNPRNLESSLFDILAAAKFFLQFTKGMTIDEFKKI